MKELTISIISCNQCHDLKKLLPSLIPAAKHIDAEILLIDNRSNDATSEYIHQYYPEIQVTYNPDITGYGENHNINLSKARGRYFVAMNSDMLVENSVFVQLFDYMDTHPDIGIISPKVLSEDGSIQGLNKRYPTLLDLFLRRFVNNPPRILQKVVQHRLDYYEMRDVGYDRICDVEFLSGAFMFCRAELLKSIGGFDPQYFLYFEDVDLCRRVQRTHRTTYFPFVSVTHYWKRSAHINWKFTLYFIRSAYRYFNKWGYSFS